MQKNAIAIGVALCVMGVGSSYAQNPSKVELWGVVDAAIRHTNNHGATGGNQTQMIGGGMSQSRWGLNVEEDLGQGSKALVHLEHRFNADNGAKDATAPFFQLSYVGLQGPYGRITAGRQWNVLFDVVSSTYASFPYSPYMEAYKPELGMAVGARTSNALKYTFATPSRNFVGGLQYSFDEKNRTEAFIQDVNAVSQRAGGAAAQQAVAAGAQAGLDPTTIARNAQLAAQQAGAQAAQAYMLANRDEIVQIGLGAMRTAGGFLRFSQSGFSVGGAYLKTTLPGRSSVDAWTMGGSYRSGPWYVNLGYGENKFKASGGTFSVAVDRMYLNDAWSSPNNGGFQAGDANKRRMAKVGFGYQATSNINLGLHYYHAKQSGSATGAYNGKADFIVAALDYQFSKRTDAYVAVDHTKLKGGSGMSIDAISTSQPAVKSRTGFTVGLRHRF